LVWLGIADNNAVMLTSAQRDEFDQTGIVKIESVFSEAEAARMRDVVWAELAARHGMARDDPTTWQPYGPTGMTTSKRHSAFRPILGPALRDGLDGLLGPGRWAEPKHHGQVLITMPNTERWVVPDRLWHTDIGYESLDVLVGLKHWAFLDTVEPGGGRTVQLAGSHRLLSSYVRAQRPENREYKRIRDGFLRSHPWLHALSKPDDDPSATIG
jgi:hypothetical protein